MTHRKESPAPIGRIDRSSTIVLINMTGHLLLSVVSLERRIASVPKQLSALVEGAGRRRVQRTTPGSCCGQGDWQ